MSLVDKEKIKTRKSFMQKLACYPVFVYIVSAIAFEMTPETSKFSTLAIYALFAAGLFYIFRAGKILANEYVVFSMLFLLYVCICCLFKNASTTMNFRIFYLVLTCTVAALMVFWMSSKYPNMITYAMAAYIIGSLILSFRIVMMYGGIETMVEYASSEGEYRIGKLIGNENGIGLFLANGILCSLVFLIEKKGLIIKLFTIASMVSLGAMLLLTGSRKSLAFVLLGVVFIVYLNYRKEKISKKMSAFLICAIVLFLVYNAINTLPVFSTIKDRLDLLFQGFFGNSANYETDETRKWMIQEGLNAFYDKPFFGNGTGYSYKLFGTYSHNNFVELLMNYGIFGFALYYIPLLVLLSKLFKQVMLRKDIYATYLFVYVCIQLVLGVGWVNYYERSVQLLIALSFGYLLSTSKRREKDEI